MRCAIVAFVFVPLLGSSSRAIAQPSAPVINAGLPSVSPDGRHIAFISNRGGLNDVYVMTADGTGLVRLTNSADYESFPGWTGDATRIVYSVFTADTSRVFTVAPAGGDAKLIATVPSRGPTLSPDGRKLLYSAGKFPALRLTLANVDGSSPTPISDGSRTVFDGRWSPDGKRIAFAAMDSARKMHVWIVNADGTGARQLTHIPESDGTAQWPAWSPDGKRIAVQVGKYSRVPTDNTAHVWVVDVETGSATKLAGHDRNYLDETPSWFPDGKRIAFQSDRSGRMEIWVMNADGSNARQLSK